MNQLIGITGLARSGKDTFAKGLIQRGYNRLAFADALKEVTALIANEPSHLYFDDAAKEEQTEALGMTRRLALQRVGSGIRNSLGESTWVTRVLRLWRDRGELPTCITDCRYDNEAAAIVAAGGMVVRISRPDNVGLTGEAASHESEHGVSEHLINVDILNDGTVGELSVLHDENTDIWRLGELNKNPFGGFPHKYITLYKALVGDPSDKIPGAKGFGDAKFVDLVRVFGLDGLEALTELIQQGTLDSLKEDLADLPSLKFILDDKEGVARVGAMWRCRCDCGTLRNVRQDNMRSGQSRSCGCVGAVKKSLDMAVAFSRTTQRRAAV